MRRFFVFCVVVWLLTFLIPAIMLRNEPKEIPELPLPGIEEKVESVADSEITVTLNNNGQKEEIPLNEYLQGVVAAEMPALFPEEALKAQAVAARTYTMKKISESYAPEHNGTAVCNNPSHCKAYSPITSFAANWNTAAEEYTDKICRAVANTDGEIMLYDGSPITAVFHSTSSGKTENSSDVWGGNLPYLVSVESPGEKESPHYETEIKLTPEEFKTKFSEKYPSAVFDPNPENWITDILRSEAGSIKQMKVAGVSVKGSDVRIVFGLKSANFTILYIDGEIRIKTRGYGHGVGMSQYGARAMALEGKTYDEILKSYYTGVTLGKIKQKSSS